MAIENDKFLKLSDAQLLYDNLREEIDKKYTKPKNGIAKQDVNIKSLGLAAKADKSNTVLLTTLSRGRANDEPIGQGSFAFGVNVTASGEFSHAEGNGTVSDGYCAHAEGYQTEANGADSHAEGKYAQASGDYSHAEGFSTEASGANSHAEGMQTEAQGENAHAEGYISDAIGTCAHAEGRYTHANGDYSHTEGYGTIANGAYSHVMGQYNIEDSYDNWVTWEPSVRYYPGDKVKYSSNPNIDNPTWYYYICKTEHVSSGYPNTSTNQWERIPTGIMNYALIIGNGEVGQGYLVRSNALMVDWQGNMILDGGLKIGSTIGSHKIGHGSFSTSSSEASGDQSHAEGNYTKATAPAAHAEGYFSEAKGNDAHAEGYYTQANANYSHAEGDHTIADSTGSHAEGYNSQANGYYSHAEGESTETQGQGSHAEGQHTVATGAGSHAQGKYNIIDDYSDWKQWKPNTYYYVGNKIKYFISNKWQGYICNADHFSYTSWQYKYWDLDAKMNYAEIVGNGTPSKRSNSRTLDWDGNESLAGDLIINKGTINEIAIGKELNNFKNTLSIQDEKVIGPTKTTTIIANGVNNNIPIKKIDISFKPIQDLHGYDKPWIAGSGKNLLGIKLTDCQVLNTSGIWVDNVYTYNNITFTVNTTNDGYITTIQTSGTASADITFMVGGISLTADITYRLSGCPSGGSNSKYRLTLTEALGEGQTILTSDVGSTTAVSYKETENNNRGIQIEIKNGKIMDNKTFSPMVRLSTETDTTFTPYSNICPITGHSSVTVSKCGKNLIDLTEIVQGRINDVGALSEDDAYVTTGYIPIVSGEQYIASIESGKSLVSYRYYTEDKTAIGTANITTNPYTTPTNAAFVRITFKNSDDSNIIPSDVTSAQLEVGSTATAYETYTKQTLPISLTTIVGNDVYYGSAIINEDGSGTIRLDYILGTVIVDPTSSGWTNVSGYNSKYKTYSNVFSETVLGYNYGKGNENYISNILSIYNHDPAYGECAWYVTQYNGTNIRIYIPKTMTDTFTFQAIAKLATPISYNFSATQLTTLLGSNTIWTDDGEMTITCLAKSLMPPTPSTNGTYVLKTEKTTNGETRKWVQDNGALIVNTVPSTQYSGLKEFDKTYAEIKEVFFSGKQVIVYTEGQNIATWKPVAFLREEYTRDEQTNEITHTMYKVMMSDGYFYFIDDDENGYPHEYD